MLIKIWRKMECKLTCSKSHYRDYISHLLGSKNMSIMINELPQTDSNQLVTLTDHEMSNINGGLTIGEGLTGIGIVLGAGLAATAAPFVAGAVLVGVIGVAAIDIASNLAK
jgi:hypothetical protein